MAIYTATVQDRTITMDKYDLVQNNVSIDQLVIVLDDEWDGNNRIKVVFYSASVQKEIDYVEGGIDFPWEITENSEGFKMTLVGYFANGDRIVTREMKEFMNVNKSGLVEGDEAGEATKDIYQKIVEAAYAIEESANAAIEGANTAADAANEAAANANAAADEVMTELVDIRVGYDGATYATAGAAVRGQVENIHEEIGYLHNEKARYEFASDVASETGNGYLSSNGTIVADSNWWHTDNIPVSAGDIIAFNLYSGSTILILAMYDANGGIVRSYNTPTWEQHSDVVIVPETCVSIVVTFRLGNDHGAGQYLRVYGSSGHEINASELVENATVFEGKYWDTGTRLGTISDWIAIEFDVSEYAGKVANTNILFGNRTMAYNWVVLSNGTVAAISGYTDSDGETVSLPDNALKVRMSWRTDRISSAFFTVSEYLYEQVNALSAKVKSQSVPKSSPLSAFNNLICIGDSLTYSQVYTSSDWSTARQANRTYPEILCKYLGCDDYKIVAVPGYTPSGMWNNYRSEIVAAENQLAIIYLGTNGGLTDTVDTDCPENTPYSSFASTETGCYGKIIAKCIENGAKVLLLRCYYTGINLAVTNAAIDHLAERFGCAVVDAPDATNVSGLMLWPDKGGSSYPHYNDLGYSWFARELADSIVSNAGNSLMNLIPE